MCGRTRDSGDPRHLLRQLLDECDAHQRAALRHDVAAYHLHYSTAAGIHVRREYLCIVGDGEGMGGRFL